MPHPTRCACPLFAADAKTREEAGRSTSRDPAETSRGNAGADFVWSLRQGASRHHRRRVSGNGLHPADDVRGCDPVCPLFRSHWCPRGNPGGTADRDDVHAVRAAFVANKLTYRRPPLGGGKHHSAAVVSADCAGSLVLSRSSLDRLALVVSGCGGDRAGARSLRDAALDVLDGRLPASPGTQ